MSLARSVSPRREFRFAAFLAAAVLASLGNAPAWAEDKSASPAKPTEADYYPMFALPIPEGVVLESGALEWMPDGRLAVASRRGEIWMVSNPTSDDSSQIKFTRFASGLHEVLGLAQRDGWLYVVQRGEVSRVKDEDGDGRADRFETFCDDWGINGDYHEYAFGSKFDRDGNLWVVLCLTGSFSSQNKYRGWALRITPDGKAIPTTSGLRSPGGLGMNAEGDMFYTDNQGPWNGACKLQHLAPGRFVGHPAGNRWYDQAPGMGPEPVEPKSGGRLVDEADKIPALLPPAVYFPYPKMGNSSSGIACDTSGGKFGVFEKQLFVGDQSQSFISRVMLEKVDGDYQGACVPFRSGFSSGCLALLQAPNGMMFVQGTSRGWGARRQGVFARTARMVGQDTLRDRGDAREARWLRIDLYRASRSRDRPRSEVVHRVDLHLYLSVELRQPRGRHDHAHDRAGGSLDRWPLGAAGDQWLGAWSCA